jgi:hypothetical protein
MRLMFQCEDAALGARDGLFADYLEALHAQLQVANHAAVSTIHHGIYPYHCLPTTV